MPQPGFESVPLGTAVYKKWIRIDKMNKIMTLCYQNPKFGPKKKTVCKY